MCRALGFDSLILGVIPSTLNSIRYRRFLFSVNDHFLTAAEGPCSDISYFIQSPVNVNNQLAEFYTLLVDLQEPQENIWQNIYHRTRSEINSFIKNQTFEHKLLFPLSDKELDHYIKLFDAFAKHKKIRKAEAFRLKAYNKNGLLAVSIIKQNGQLLCVNVYRLNQLRATNLYSFTLKHSNHHNLNSSQFGRAHRALHWLDMLAFKNMNVKHYDFCGWYDGQEDKLRLQINAFKEQFTTHKVKEYSGVLYHHPLLKRFLNRRK